ncbi:MAG: hypothetical protein GWN85_42260, partial [Gemmatimonadetes bacterium]|nr:hypothetical protein [Gemmatimonadota bacterium]
VNPNLVAARAFRAKLLLEIENYEGAAEAAQRALEVNPVSAEALAVLAAVRYLERDQEEFVSVLRRALRYNP